MGPKGKKQQKNAFSFFLEDYVEKLNKNGRYIPHKIAAEECGELWKALPEAEKNEYFQKAKNYRLFSKGESSKLTTTGITYVELGRQQEELKKKAEDEDMEIKAIITSLDEESIKTQPFHIVHCNYYCKTTEGKYVPGEIAIAEFTLLEGIRKTFHCLVNPGDIPLGYALEAKQTIEDFHGLPYPPYSEGESNFREICEGILSFLESCKARPGLLPPMYTTENNISASENIISELVKSTGDDRYTFRVYLLSKMFFALKNQCVKQFNQENLGFPVFSTAENEIAKDSFCYYPGISCAYHEMLEDKYQSCSLSVVQRYSYFICDHCCQHVGIELIPGKHCGINAEIHPDGYTIMPTRGKERVKSRKVDRAESSTSYTSASSGSMWQRKSGSFLHEEVETRQREMSYPSYSAAACGRGSAHAGPAPKSESKPEGSSRSSRPDLDEANFPSMRSGGRGIRRF